MQGSGSFINDGIVKKSNVLSLVVVVIGTFVFSGCSGGGNEKTTPNPDLGSAKPTSYDYTTIFREIASSEVTQEAGGVIEVTDSKSPLYGVKISIPADALSSNQTIVLSEVDNPPALPEGLNYIGMPIDLSPDGLSFFKKVIVELPYTDAELSDAGISDDATLKVFSYDKTTGEWEEATIVTIDTVNNKITAELSHFSIVARTGFNATPPANLGIPQPGDLLYKTGIFYFESSSGSWRPGHVGIYTGEKTYSGTGLASESVKKFGRYNVIEALGDGVQYSYYDIPNVIETHETDLGPFNHSDVYMGAREPIDAPLTPLQRETIVTFFVEGQVGKKYAVEQTLGSFAGFLPGSSVKGPSKFNCVGLAEKAYEVARVNEGEGLVSSWQEIGLLTPAEQYNQTKPAGSGTPKQPVKIISINHVMNVYTISPEIRFKVKYDIPEGNVIDRSQCIVPENAQEAGYSCFTSCFISDELSCISIKKPAGAGSIIYKVWDRYGNITEATWDFSWDCCEGGGFACQGLGGNINQCGTQN